MYRSFFINLLLISAISIVQAESTVPAPHLDQDDTTGDSWSVTLNSKGIAAGIAIATGAALLAAPVAIPALVGTLGFTSSGIVAGSWAAGFMASYGGTVGSGSVCALLQSLGAGTFAGSGVTTLAGAAISTTGVVLAAAGPSIRQGATAAMDFTVAGVKSIGDALGNVDVEGLKSLPGAIDSVAGAGGHLISEVAAPVGDIAGASTVAAKDFTVAGVKSVGDAVGNVDVEGLKSIPGAIDSVAGAGGHLISEVAAPVGDIAGASTVAAKDFTVAGVKSVGDAVGNVDVEGLKSIPGAIDSVAGAGGHLISEVAARVGDIAGASTVGAKDFAMAGLKSIGDAVGKVESMKSHREAIFREVGARGLLISKAAGCNIGSSLGVRFGTVCIVEDSTGR